jgi:hypothetical protein
MATSSETHDIEDHHRPHKRQRTCRHCGQSFSKAEHLDRHVRSHTKEKPFACTLCVKSYGRQDSLQRHMRSHGETWTNDLPSGVPANASTARQDGREGEPLATASTLVEGSTANTADTLSLPPDINHSESAWNATETFSYDPAMIQADMNNTSPSDADLMCLSIPPLEPSWQLHEDFDVPSLSSSIAAAIFDWGWATGSVAEDPQSAVLGDAAHLRGTPGINDGQSATSNLTRVQQTWYTKVTPDASASRTRRPSQQEAVDESYRESLSRRLQARMTEDALPSADFLVCLHVLTMHSAKH